LVHGLKPDLKDFSKSWWNWSFLAGKNWPPLAGPNWFQNRVNWHSWRKTIICQPVQFFSCCRSSSIEDVSNNPWKLKVDQNSPDLIWYPSMFIKNPHYLSKNEGDFCRFSLKFWRKSRSWDFKSRFSIKYLEWALLI
jgi:hypothetical protein